MICKTMLLFGIGALSAATSASALDSCSAKSGAAFVPLVELYTSEGCSSCPPADSWLSTQRSRTDINLLAFHVDYWDYIGWKDRFASPAYSQRQRERVEAAGSGSVYTPQVMVGGNVTTAWQSRDRFNAALAAQQEPSRPTLALAVSDQQGGLQATLSYATEGTSGRSGNLWLAQYRDGQTSEVRAGENRGATLHHDRVVQTLWGPWPLNTAAETRTQAVKVPEGAWGLVAFVQDDQGHTLQSLALPVSTCAKVHK